MAPNDAGKPAFSARLFRSWRLGYWQKVYFSVLCLFLVFFNFTVFAVAAYTNTDAFDASRDKLLTQQHYIVQSLTDDMNSIYTTRPHGLAKLYEKKGNAYLNTGILFMVCRNGEVQYSSFAPDYRCTLSPAAGQRSWQIETIGGEKLLVASTALTEPFAGTTVTAAFSMQEFFARWNRTLRSVQIAALVFSVLLAAALYFLLKLLSAPLARLSRATASLIEGDYAARVAYRGEDEIGQLAARFNAMAGKIEQQVGELQQEAEEKQRLIDALSHELRTPLAAISGYTQYMQMAELGEEDYYNTLEVIAFETGRMQQLADRILSLSALEHSGLPECRRIQISALLTRLKALYAPRAEREQIAFSIELRQDFSVSGDFVLLESLLSNLVDNAMKACAVRREHPDASYLPELKLLAFSGAEGSIIELTDNGCGMSAAALAEIGKPFYREDKARSRRFGGAGLGVSICQKIAAAHGATLTFSSAPGAGTTARLSFTTR